MLLSIIYLLIAITTTHSAAFNICRPPHPIAHPIMKQHPTAQQRVDAINAYLTDRRKTYPAPSGFSVYEPRPTDVIVTTYPKAGTTLMQQLCYQVAVATGGAPPADPTGDQFVDICQMVLWLEYAPEMGIHSVDSSPRIYKSHSRAEKFAVDKQKHVVVIRNPLKYPGSWMEFVFDSLPQEFTQTADADVRRIMFDDTVTQDLLGLEANALHTAGEFGGGDDAQVGDAMGSWLHHTKGWLENLAHPNVLILFYEEVVKDLRSTAIKVAKFMGREMTDVQADKVASRCNRQYIMRGDRFKSILDEKVFGINAQSAKVKDASREGWPRMTIQEQHVRILNVQMKRALGVDGYDGLRDFVRGKYVNM